MLLLFAVSDELSARGEETFPYRANLFVCAVDFEGTDSGLSVSYFGFTDKILPERFDYLG